MQIYRFRNILSAFFCFFFSHFVFAISVVQTEFEMLLPRSFQQNLIEQEWDTLQKEVFHLTMPIADQTYDTPDVKVFLTGLQIDVQSKLEKPGIGSEGESILLRSRKLEGSLHIQTVNIDQWIEREVGGVIGRFRVQARCDGVVVGLKPGKAALTMKLSPVFDGAVLRANVDDANLTWDQDAWEITALQCSGAQGLDEIIKQEVLKLTSDPKIVAEKKDLLMQYVRDYVSAKSLDLSKPRTLVTARPDIKMSMSITDFTGTEANARVRGLLRADFTRDKSNEEVNLKLGNGSIGSGNTAMLRVPEEFVLAVAKKAYAGNSWVEKVYSTNIPGFSALTKSRFTQFFVWRALMDYPKTAKFLFEVYSPKNISMTGSNLTYDVKAPLYAKMYAPKNGDYIPFMNFYAPLTSKVKLSLSKGIATAKFTNFDMDLKEGWDPSYVAKYYPNKTFDGETIRKHIVQAAEGKSLSYTIPTIPVADDVSLKVQKVQSLKGGDLVLYLKMPSKSAPTPK